MYVNLTDRGGDALATWEGWPLDLYPTSAWRQQIATRFPVTLHLPADLPAGTYSVDGGWIDPATGLKSPPTRFGQVAVTSRLLSLTPTPSDVSLEPSPQFGTHARLRGYTLIARRRTGVVEPHLGSLADAAATPPHLHPRRQRRRRDARASRWAACDRGYGPAPTGSWRPGEFIVTHHMLNAPADAVVLRLGLYGARLRSPAARHPRRGGRRRFSYHQPLRPARGEE